MGDLIDMLIEKLEKEMISIKDAESIFYEFPRIKKMGEMMEKFGFPILWMTLNKNDVDWNKLVKRYDLKTLTERYSSIPRAGIVTTKAFFLSNEYGIEKNMNEFLNHSFGIFKEPKFYNIDFLNKQNMRYLIGDSQILTIQGNDEELNLGKIKDCSKYPSNVFELFINQ